MSNKNNTKKSHGVNSFLDTKESAESLEHSLADLQQLDPSQERAMAIFKDFENIEETKINKEQK